MGHLIPLIRVIRVIREIRGSDNQKPLPLLWEGIPIPDLTSVTGTSIDLPSSTSSLFLFCRRGMPTTGSQLTLKTGFRSPIFLIRVICEILCNPWFRQSSIPYPNSLRRGGVSPPDICIQSVQDCGIAIAQTYIRLCYKIDAYSPTN